MDKQGKVFYAGFVLIVLLTIGLGVAADFSAPQTRPACQLGVFFFLVAASAAWFLVVHRCVAPSKQ